MLVLWSYSNDRKSSWDKANVCDPKTKTGSQPPTYPHPYHHHHHHHHQYHPSPANRTSAETHSIPNVTIPKRASIILGVWSYLISHRDNFTSVQTVAACLNSSDCTFAWRHQPCLSHRTGNQHRHATPYSHWPFLQGTNINDDVTHSSSGLIHVYIHIYKKTYTLIIDDFVSPYWTKKSHTKSRADHPKSRGSSNIRALLTPSNTCVSEFQCELSIIVIILDRIT